MTEPMRSVVDWWFRDRRTGQIVIGQFPNLPLWLFIAGTAVGWLATSDSSVGRLAWVVATVGLGWWAVAEVSSGVNPWRRALGVGGVALLVLRILT